MNIIYNGSSLPIGGSSKITDYLEDPVEITNFTLIDIFNLSKDYVLFGDFYYHSSSYTPIRYIGYIPLTDKSYDRKNFDGPPVAYSSVTNGNYYFNIRVPYLFESNNVVRINTYNMMEIINNSAKTISYPSNYDVFYGKIWVGKYKQQVTE